ncbi:HD domain-containing protein [Bacillus seohaeanensis]|uniref:HD domain-containing protein n=1 Tax=Bacillus seohaeanensis TaxID=284580 RepID=A0ABW5RR61_9BACI
MPLSNVEKVTDYLKPKFSDDASGHDWHHLERVRRLSLYIAKQEGLTDLHSIELAALLHDVSDEKLNDNRESGQKKLENILLLLDLTDKEREKIQAVIASVSFKGGNETAITEIEAKVVRDADRLDAIGAIGIARTFAYGGSKGNPLFNPELRVRENMTIEEYRNGETSTIHHFYEKLLKLKNLMCTETGRKLAEERHAFMEGFLQQFFKEWNGQG